jgi:hypothetical protein
MLEPAQPETTQPQRATDPSGQAALPAMVAPAPTNASGVLALQRSAGNAAVSRLLAGGEGRPAVLARQQKEDPPQLPISGDANFMLLDHERTFPIALPDLGEFDFGKGELSTGAIELGEGVEATLDVGAHNPPRIADASLHLSPVEANVAASLIAERRKAKEYAGIEGAAIGGIVGGLGGALIGQPLAGAEKGGLLGGKAAEAATGWGMDRFSLEASLVSGALSGHLRLVYNPFIRLRLGVSLLSQVFTVDAKLQTQIGLSLVPSLAVAGSKVGLHFEDGKLARSEFSLELEAAIEAALDVAGMLQIGATVLKIIDNDSSDADKKQAHDEPGLLHINILETDVFPIVEDLRGNLKAKTKLDFLKASPLDLVKKHYEAKDGAVSDLLTTGLKKDLAPAVKKARGGKGKGKGADPPDGGGGRPGEPRYHTGTFGDPIPMIWFKRPDLYPDTLHHRGVSGKEDVHKFPHRTYSDGLEAGVDAAYWPWIGKKFKKEPSTRKSEGSTKGQADLAKQFEEHDVEVPGGVAQIDHVFDDFLGGPDQPDNLWPLLTQYNRDTGSKHGNQSVRYRPEDDPTRSVPTAATNVPVNKWFIITVYMDPGANLPPEPPGAPEYLG